MNINFKFYLKLFLSTFYLSAFTFGGGYVIVPLMRKKFVEDYKWIEEKEMLDLTAIAQSSPGPIAVNASILVGYRLAGILGAFTAIFGTVLPPFIILSVISIFYTAFKENEAIQAVLKGMSAGVAAVVADVTLSMGKEITKEKNIFSVVIMLAAFAAVFFFNIDVKLIILLSGLLGISILFIYRLKHREIK